MKKSFPVLMLVLFGSVLFVNAQSLGNEKLAEYFKKTLGGDCKIITDEGKEISFEQAAKEGLQGVISGKRIYMKPFKVVNGKYVTAMFLLKEPADSKTLYEEINFKDTGLTFFNQAKEKVTPEVFKQLLQANNNLIVLPYNANLGLIKDYIIGEKPNL